MSVGRTSDVKYICMYKMNNRMASPTPKHYGDDKVLGNPSFVTKLSYNSAYSI